MILLASRLYPQKWLAEESRKTDIAQEMMLSGKRFMNLNSFESAVHHLKYSAQVCDGTGNYLWNAVIYKELAIAYLHLIKYDSSQLYLQKALKASELDGSPGTLESNRQKREIFYYLGIVHYLKMHYGESLPYFMDCLNFLEKEPEDTFSSGSERLYQIAQCHFNMGMANYNLGDFVNALESFYRGLQVRLSDRELASDSVELGNYYLNIALAHRAIGDYNKSLEILLKASTYNTGNTYFQSIVFNNIGLNHYDLKEYLQSIIYFKESLRLRHILFPGDHYNNALLYNNIANVHYRLGSVDSALYFLNLALGIYIRDVGHDTEKTAFTCNNLAGVYADLEQFDTALFYYQKSLQIRTNIYGEKHFKVAQVLLNMGSLYFNQKNYDIADTYLDRAILANVHEKDDTIGIEHLHECQMFSHVDMIEILELKARTLFEIYHLTNSHQSLDNAYTVISYCMELLESNFDLYRNEETKLGFAERTKPIVMLAINIAYEKNDDVAAFRFMEMGKSCVLYQMIIENHLRRNAVIPDSVVTYEKSLKFSLSEIDMQIQGAKAEKNEERLQGLIHARFPFSYRYDSVQEYIENTLVEYSRLKEHLNEVNLNDIQYSLPPKTAIIQYFTSGNTLYIFFISNQLLEIHKDTCGHQVAKDIANVIRFINLFKINEFNEPSIQLFNILFKPIQHLLSDIESLVIIPDEKLYWLPFEILLMNNHNEVSDSSISPHYLIQDFIMSYNYSSRLWYYGRNRANENPSENKITGTLLGFAPVFSYSNNTVNEKYQIPGNSASDKSLKSFPVTNPDMIFKVNELRYSEDELTGIGSLFEKKNKDAAIFLKSSATKENLLRFCNQYDIIHIASHGITNLSFPYLSGLYFSPSDHLEMKQMDMTNIYSSPGILYTGELYGLNLNTKLVVLSACETGIGKLNASEGMLALARSFLIAGSQNVVVSLWKVSDKHTKDFMLHYYDYLTDGYSFSESLQRTKLYYLSQDNLCFPFFWSGFTIIGQ